MKTIDSMTAYPAFFLRMMFSELQLGQFVISVFFTICNNNHMLGCVVYQILIVNCGF